MPASTVLFDPQRPCGATGQGTAEVDDASLSEGVPQRATCTALGGALSPVKAKATWSTRAMHSKAPRDGGSISLQDDSPCCIAAGYSPGEEASLKR